MEIFVGPDEYKLSDDESDTIITLGIGSCIVGIFYDPFDRIGGMIHVTNPVRGKEGILALIKAMEALGAKKTFIQAKIIGGAHLLNANMAAGKKNIEFIKQILEEENIRIVFEDTGLNHARNVKFFIKDGKALVKRVKKHARRN